MSRIFDALQRSGTEKSGVEYPDMMTVATEVFETPQERPTSDVDPAILREALTDLARDGFSTEEPVDTSSGYKTAADPMPAFGSVRPNISPSNRLVFFNEPNSLAAEKFRYLGVRLRQLQQSRPLKKVLITSVIPQEGKSTVAANIACTLARRRQQKTILIDGDLRRPTVAKLFGLPNLPGMSEWLRRMGTPATSIHQVEGSRLYLLPAGSVPENPLELLQSSRLSHSLQMLTNWFDWIVIDSPPVLPMADTSIWMQLADGVLLVTRQGVTERDRLRRGLAALEPNKLLGCVMNGATKTHRSDSYYQAKTIE